MTQKKVARSKSFSLLCISTAAIMLYGAGPLYAVDGSTLFQKNLFSEAAIAYQKQIANGSSTIVNRIGLVRSLIRLDKWEEALQQAHDLVLAYPRSADAHGLLALTLIRAGRPSKAAIEDSAALSLSTDSYWALVAEGRLQIWNGEETAAHATLIRAANIHPSWPEAWYYIVDTAGSEDSIQPSDFVDLASYLSLSPKGHPNNLAMQVLPSRMPLFRALLNHTPFKALNPITESQMIAADNGGKVETIEIPIQRQGNYVVISPAISGKKVRLLFDTGGGSDITLDKSILNKMNMRPITRSVIFGVSGKEPTDLYIFPTMELGGQEFGSIPVESVSSTPGDFDGIFGVSAFDSYLLTIDYSNNLLTISRGKNAIAPPPRPGDYNVSLPFHYLDGDILVPAVLAGNPVWALVDTGADAPALLSLRLARQVAAGMKPNSYKEMNINARLGIGATQTQQKIIMFTRTIPLALSDGNKSSLKWDIEPALGADLLDTQISPAEDFEIGGLLGNGFAASAKRITFDYPHKLLTLEYPLSRIH